VAPTRTIATEAAAYEVADAGRLVRNAIVVFQVVDAGRDAPVAALTVESLSPHTAAMVTSGGWVVLSGRPELAVPTLATAAQTLTVRIGLPGRAPITATVTIPMGSVLPYMTPALTVEPHPVAMAGTVTTFAYPHAAIPDAIISLVSTMPAPALLVLRTPLAAHHPAGTPVEVRSLTGAAPTTNLTADVRSGDRHVALASLAGCVVGGALSIGTDTVVEHGIIASADPAASMVLLQLPLARSAKQGAPARAHTLGAATSATALVRRALAADGVLVVDPGIAGAVVYVADAAPSQHEVRLAAALSDAGGRWRIDGVRALPRVQITAQAAGFSAYGPVIHDVDYAIHPNLVDLALSP
jgi:hypothetical protein